MKAEEQKERINFTNYKAGEFTKDEKIQYLKSELENNNEKILHEFVKYWNKTNGTIIGISDTAVNDFLTSNFK